jgi:glycosyltransferase involved in cell wall biosynthesis
MSPSAPAVSVVTPFYDTEKYLGHCIESVLGQSFGDFEYLLVDNQSGDGSFAIAESYARRDPRIRLIRNEQFLNQVQNYNQALRHISPGSRYVKIVQADDWIFARCLGDMIELAQANPSVAVVSSYELKGTDVHGAGLPFGRSVIPGREACRLHLLEGIYMFGSPTTLLFRADVVRARDPFYEDGRFHEDTEAVYEVLRGQDFGFVHQVLSSSRLDLESISGAVRSFDPHALDRLILVKRYGRSVLEPAELARCLEHAETRYYRCLARAVLARRGEAYWDYHRRGLATIGESIDRKRLFKATVPAMLDWALSSKAALSVARNKLRATNGR